MERDSFRFLSLGIFKVLFLVNQEFRKLQNRSFNDLSMKLDEILSDM